MDKISLALSALLGIALVVMMAPSVIAMNRGKMLRNVALWLAIVLGLALFYRHFGPTDILQEPAASAEKDDKAGNDNDDTTGKVQLPPDQQQDDDDQGYTPPRD